MRAPAVVLKSPNKGSRDRGRGMCCSLLFSFSRSHLLYHVCSVNFHLIQVSFFLTALIISVSSCLFTSVCFCLYARTVDVNKDAKSTTCCTDMFLIDRLHSSKLERKVINVRQRAEDTGTDRQHPFGTC